MTGLIIVIILLFGLIVIGSPIFLALGFSGLVGLYLSGGSTALFLLPSSFMGQLNSFELVALPLFILMGNLIGATPAGSLLFNVALKWFGWIRGSLAICSVGAAAAFGAISGVSIAGVATIGSVAVPEMLQRGYNRKLAAGSVVTAGALAMLIPPSIPFIIYGSISGVSVAALFIGGLVPGLVLASALSIYIYCHALLFPQDAPRYEKSFSWRERIVALRDIWHTLFLFVLVIGSIYLGIATPSEAAAFGAAGAFLIALWFGVRSLKVLSDIIGKSIRVSCAILIIMGCAKIFGDYLNFLHMPKIIASTMTETGLPSIIVLVAIMIILILLGMFVDAISLIVVTTPIFLPVVTSLGYDPLWFGIVMVISLEIAVVTPPVGLNLYTLQSVCPELSVEEIIRSSLPFIMVQFLVFSLFVAFPGLSLWLPELMPS